LKNNLVDYTHELRHGHGEISNMVEAKAS